MVNHPNRAQRRGNEEREHQVIERGNVGQMPAEIAKGPGTSLEVDGPTALTEAWNPDAEGKSAAFRGQRLRGVAMGMNR